MVERHKWIYRTEGSEVGGRGQRVCAVVHKVSQTELTAGVPPKCCPASTCNPHRALHIQPQHKPACVCVCGMPPTHLKKHADTLERVS